LDYYQVLRVSPNASKKEIDQAYERLIKESRYDASIDRRVVESAYRILGDSTHKDAYDSMISTKEQKGKVRSKKRWSPKLLSSLSRRDLLRILVVLSIVMVIFYWYRFGHLLKDFEVGDYVYLAEGKRKLGRIVEVERNHRFQSFKADAFLVKKDSGETVWLTERDMQIHCYRKKQ